MSQEFKKMTAEIPRDDFDRVADRVHHGMITSVMRQIFKSLGEKLEKEGRAELYEYIDGKGNLNLAPPEED